MFVKGGHTLVNISLEDGLVSRGNHLVLLREIHPELAHLKCATPLAELFRMELLMNDATSRSHPLDVSRTNHALIPGAVLVLNLPLERQGDGLETPVRVLRQMQRAKRAVKR